MIGRVVAEYLFGNSPPDQTSLYSIHSRPLFPSVSFLAVSRTWVAHSVTPVCVLHQSSLIPSHPTIPSGRGGDGGDPRGEEKKEEAKRESGGREERERR